MKYFHYTKLLSILNTYPLVPRWLCINLIWFCFLLNQILMTVWTTCVTTPVSMELVHTLAVVMMDMCSMTMAIHVMVRMSIYTADHNRL